MILNRKFFVTLAVALLVAFGASIVRAEPYVSVSLDTSNSPHRSTELQSRFEVGYGHDSIPLDVYIYHESDPTNGFEGSEYVGETENGLGLRIRYDFE